MAGSEVQEQGSAKRWLGYTCPECYAIFRVPTDGQGKVAECPHCRLPVVLGRKGPVDGPVLASEEIAEVDENVPEGWERSERSGRLKRKKRVTKKKRLETPDWDAGELGGNERPQGAKFFLVLLAGLLVLTAGVGVFLKRLVEAQQAKIESVDMGEISVVDLAEEVAGAPEDPEALEDYAFKEQIEKVRATVEAFLVAESEEDLLPRIRSRERVAPLLRAFHRKHGLQPVKYREIAPAGGLQVKGDLLSVVVVFDDYSRRSIALEESEGGFLVDWESWIGYGDLSWRELLTLRPTKPVLMRVRVSAIDYYNFDFSDDKRWKSVRLIKGEEDKPLYGYVESGSELERQLAPGAGAAKSRAMILRLRYPEGATRDDQVIIEEMVANGWVQP